MRRRFLIPVLLCVLTNLPADGAAQNAPIPFQSGQGITPSFEGWFRNPDGTTSLSFGYMNRNYKEELDIPIGPNNRVEPGAQDQGQPTHFLPRRQTGIFTVVVPKDFPPNQKVTGRSRPMDRRSRFRDAFAPSGKSMR